MIEAKWKAKGQLIPPSSLAMTKGLSSMVQAIELYELPNEIPIAQRSAGATPD